MVHDARLGFPALALLIAEEMPVLSRRTREPVRFSVEEQEERRKKDVHPVSGLREQALPATRPAASSQGSGIPSPVFKVGDTVRIIACNYYQPNHLIGTVGVIDKLEPGGHWFLIGKWAFNPTEVALVEAGAPVFKVGDRVRSKSFDYLWPDLAVVQLNPDGHDNMLFARRADGLIGGFFYSDLKHAEGSK
jgi:hypothetical protein